MGGIYSLRYEGENDALLNAAGEGLIVPPYGVDGGDSGTVHNYRIIRDGKELPLGTRDTNVRIARGDVIVCEAAGGGGYGDPRERERALIDRDLEYGYITKDAVRSRYGIER